MLQTELKKNAELKATLFRLTGSAKYGASAESSQFQQSMKLDATMLDLKHQAHSTGFNLGVCHPECERTAAAARASSRNAGAGASTTATAKTSTASARMSSTAGAASGKFRPSGRTSRSAGGASVRGTLRRPPMHWEVSKVVLANHVYMFYD